MGQAGEDRKRRRRGFQPPEGLRAPCRARPTLSSAHQPGGHSNTHTALPRAGTEADRVTSESPDTRSHLTPGIPQGHSPSLGVGVGGGVGRSPQEVDQGAARL